jgi:hypothetical protein
VNSTVFSKIGSEMEIVWGCWWVKGLCDAYN